MSVTVYILNKNYGQYLGRAIDSVIFQSHKDLEIFYINDASTDNSEEIIDKYKNLGKIKIFNNKKSLGLIPNANIALKNSTKKYIIRLDADDYFNEDAIKNLYEASEKSEKVGLVYGNYNLVDDVGNILKRRLLLSLESEVKIINSPCHGACTLFLVDALKSIGGYSEEFDRQDGVYAFYSLLANNWKVKNISNIIFNYTQHNNSLSTDIPKLHQTRSEIIEKISKKNKILKKGNILISIFDINVLQKLFVNFGDFNQYLKNKISQYLNLEFINKIILVVNDKTQINLENISEKLVIINIDNAMNKKFCFNNNFKRKLTYICQELSLPEDEILIIRNIEYPNTKIYYINMTYYLLQLINEVKTTITVRKLDEPLIFNSNGSLKFDNSNEIEFYEREEKFIQCGGIITTFISSIIKEDEKIINEPFIGIEIDQSSSIHLSRYVSQSYKF